MENQSIVQQKWLQYINQQQSVGISLLTFKQKFVFNQNSGPDAFFLDFNTPSPSQIHGMTIKQQNQCLFMMSQMIFKAGQVLKLPITTTLVALNIAQYYYSRKSFLQFDFRDICMGSMFLACKSQQTLRKSYQIASSFDYIFKMYEGTRVIKQLELNSPQYVYLKEKVTKTQNQILFQLGFQVHRLFDIPHRYISGLITSFSKHKSFNQIVQKTWMYLNDIYRTKATLYYPGQMIASTAVFLSLQKLQIPLPQKPWWILMETSIVTIQNIAFLTNQMYEVIKNNHVNINKVSQILQRVGKTSLNISNVFPVPYYRKIALQKQDLLMKVINQLPIQNLENPNSQTKQKQEKEKHEKNEYSYEKSKKEKKKHKKKHKHHKNGNRSRSRSQQKNKLQTKGKYQNDDETPKIERKASFDYLRIKHNQNFINQQKQSLKIQLQNQYSGHFKIQEHSMKKEVTLKVVEEIPSVSKKPAILDAKSMLSKISQQIKKIEVKNDKFASLNIKVEKKDQDKQQKQAKNEQFKTTIETNKIIASESQSQKQKKEKYGQAQQSESDSQQQDQLMAQLIQIKKKNLQKKEQNN